MRKFLGGLILLGATLYTGSVAQADYQSCYSQCHDICGRPNTVYRSCMSECTNYCPRHDQPYPQPRPYPPQRPYPNPDCPYPAPHQFLESVVKAGQSY